MVDRKVCYNQRKRLRYPGELASRTLRKKYKLDKLALRATAENRNWLQFEHEGVLVAAGCTEPSAKTGKETNLTAQAGATPATMLQLEYQHVTASKELVLARALWSEQVAAQEQQLGAAIASLTSARNKVVAHALVSGDAYQIDQILGIDVREMVKPIGTFEPDQQLELPLQGVAAPFRGQSAALELDPDGYLIRAEVIVLDAQGVHLQRVKESLQDQFGIPRKATQRHVIFAVGQDYLILRKQKDQLKLSMVVAERERAQKARLMVAAHRRWQDETAGL